MSITADASASSTDDALEHADSWGQRLAEHLEEGATLWVWGDRDHRQNAYDLVDGLIERGAIGRVRHLRLDAPLSTARTAAVRHQDLVILYLGDTTPRSAMHALYRTGATAMAITTGDTDWSDVTADSLPATPDDLRRITARIVLAYARSQRRRHPDAPPPLPFAAAYPREVWS